MASFTLVTMFVLVVVAMTNVVNSDPQLSLYKRNADKEQEYFTGLIIPENSEEAKSLAMAKRDPQLSLYKRDADTDDKEQVYVLIPENSAEAKSLGMAKREPQATFYKPAPVQIYGGKREAEFQ